MLVVEKKKYKMFIDEDKRQIHSQIIGFIRDTDMEEYLVDFTEMISKVRKSDYVLVIDGTLQSPLPKAVVNDLGQTIMAYITLGFKDVYIVYPKSKISSVQVRNAAAEVGFPGKLVLSTAEIPAG